jgi:lysophospholipase L1-like esterase
MQNRRFVFAAYLALFLSGATWAQGQRPLLFTDGDRVLFVGDSITHIRKYHVFVAVYYAARFPGRRITFLNGGIGGDTAPLTLKRVESDIAACKPTKISVMLGMNDAGGKETCERPEAEMLPAREAHVERYRHAFPELVEALRALGPPVTLITPSPYDETAEIPAASLYGKNGALEILAEFVRSYGLQNRLPVVDFFAPMIALNAKLQEKDREQTRMGKDRVHPGDEGHLVMAAEFLKAQKVPSLVARTKMDAKYGSTSYEFDYQPQALPFPVSEAYKRMDPMIGFTEQFNREILAITGLAPGEYSLEMDGIEIGRYDARALSLGINLATNQAAPGQKQAQAVAELVHKRAAIPASLRDILWVELRLKNAGADPSDEDAVLKLLGGENPRVKKFPEARTRVPEMERQVAALEDDIYRVNRPPGGPRPCFGTGRRRQRGDVFGATGGDAGRSEVGDERLSAFWYGSVACGAGADSLQQGPPVRKRRADLHLPPDRVCGPGRSWPVPQRGRIPAVRGRWQRRIRHGGMDCAPSVVERQSGDDGRFGPRPHREPGCVGGAAPLDLSFRCESRSWHVPLIQLPRRNQHRERQRRMAGRAQHQGVPWPATALPRLR